MPGAKGKPISVLPGAHARGADRLHPSMRSRMWQRGESGNHVRARWIYLESCLLAGEASPQAMRRLIQLLNAKDERVSYMATTAVLDRSGVKPIDYDPSQDQQPAALDIAVLSDEEREQLKALAAEGDRQNVNRRGGLRLASGQGTEIWDRRDGRPTPLPPLNLK